MAPVFLAGCQNFARERLEIAAKASLLNEPVILSTKFFTILGWGKNKHASQVNVYMEGDGQAWQDPWTISNDPTPREPVGFNLARVDARPASILYLARPCQYIMDKRCTPLDWTSHRYSEKVIHAYSEALDQIKELWKAKTFALHGYSGGATVALLVAARRQDVASVATFAPLLDPVKWTAHHEYSALTDSLSPLDEAPRLKKIPQEHFIGLEDREIPLALSADYFAKIPESPIILLHKIPGFSHHSDWPGFWKSYILHKQKQ